MNYVKDIISFSFLSAIGASIAGFVVAAFAIIPCWIINLVMLVRCDFNSPWKDEITHAIGFVFAPASLITIFF